MKRFCAFLSMVALLAMTYALSGLSMPKPAELASIGGVVASVKRGMTRAKAPAPYGDVAIRDGNQLRYLRTYDLALLGQLHEGMRIQAGVYESSPISPQEIWSLNTESGIHRTHEDTYALRAGEVRKARWSYAMFCAVAMFAVFYTTRQQA